MNLTQARKMIAAGRAIVADYYDADARVQRRIRLVRIAQDAYGYLTLRGINGERIQLHASRVNITRG